MNAKTDESNSILGFLDKATLKLETLLVSFCLGAMIVIVLCQIFMRNVFDSGFVLGDPLVKHLVLWITFLGAGLASRRDSHIKIDIADKVLPVKARPIVRALVDLFSAVICAILARASYGFLAMERESGTTFGVTEIPVWVLELIIPIGFAIVALRFAYGGVASVVKAVRGGQ